MNVSAYKNNPVQRFVDTVLPRLSVAEMTNPIFQRLPQIIEMGFHNCTPQNMGQRMRAWFDNQSPHDLAQHIGHAKRWIKEEVTTYVDGKLPVWLRKPKYIIDVIRVIQYAARIVATLLFLEQMIRRAVMLANSWANECLAFVGHLQQTLSAEGLRIEAEEVLVTIAENATADITRQVTDNLREVECLI